MAGSFGNCVGIWQALGLVGVWDAVWKLGMGNRTTKFLLHGIWDCKVHTHTTGNKNYGMGRVMVCLGLGEGGQGLGALEWELSPGKKPNCPKGSGWGLPKLAKFKAT